MNLKQTIVFILLINSILLQIVTNQTNNDSSNSKNVTTKSDSTKPKSHTTTSKNNINNDFRQANPYVSRDTPTPDLLLNQFNHPANLFFYANIPLISRLANANSDIQCLYAGNKTVINNRPESFPNITNIWYIAIYQISVGKEVGFLRVTVLLANETTSLQDSQYTPDLSRILMQNEYLQLQSGFALSYKNLKNDIISNPIWTALIAAIPDFSKAKTLVPQNLTPAQLNQNKPVPAHTSGPIASTAVLNITNTSNLYPWRVAGEAISDFGYIDQNANSIDLIYVGKVTPENEKESVEKYLYIYKFNTFDDAVYLFLKVVSTPSITLSLPFVETMAVDRNLDDLVISQNVKLDPNFKADKFGVGVDEIDFLPFLNSIIFKQNLPLFPTTQPVLSNPQPSSQGTNFTIIAPPSNNTEKVKPATA